MAIDRYTPQLSFVYLGLSTDTKPDAGFGSKFIETDTGNTWLKLNTGQWMQVGTISDTAAVTFTL